MFPLETGGVLIGYWAADVKDVVVTAATGPGPNALHGEMGFVPDSAVQTEVVSRHYAASGRRHVYLGDWHSHPDGGRKLSRLDVRTLRAISADPAARIRSPLMAVLFGADVWRIQLWCLVPRRIGPWAAGCRVAPVRLQLF